VIGDSTGQRPGGFLGSDPRQRRPMIGEYGEPETLHAGASEIKQDKPRKAAEDNCRPGAAVERAVTSTRFGSSSRCRGRSRGARAETTRVGFVFKGR